MYRYHHGRGVIIAPSGEQIELDTAERRKERLEDAIEKGKVAQEFGEDVQIGDDILKFIQSPVEGRTVVVDVYTSGELNLPEQYVEGEEEQEIGWLVVVAEENIRDLILESNIESIEFEGRESLE